MKCSFCLRLLVSLTNLALPATCRVRNNRRTSEIFRAFDENDRPINFLQGHYGRLIPTIAITTEAVAHAIISTLKQVSEGAVYLCFKSPCTCTCRLKQKCDGENMIAVFSYSYVLNKLPRQSDDYNHTHRLINMWLMFVADIADSLKFAEHNCTNFK